jgi:4-amino-4-deoxy-L-arabinose transferase-like glycosyltransferase
VNFTGSRPVVLLLILSILYIGALGSTSLWDVDETRNARAAEEMMINGDLVVPTVNGSVRAHKPPLHYWFMIFAYKLFGVSEFSARFFQALFSIATVFMVVSAGSAVLGPSAGLLSGLILGVSFLFTVAARSATTDAFLVFFTNAAVLAGYFASRRKIWAVVAWVAMGFAVLAKGPVGVVLPLGALILMRLTDRHGGRSIKGMVELFPPIGILLFAAIAAPWYFLAAARTGGSLVSGFFLKHNVGRFLKPMESHGGPFYYYLLILLAGFYPWAVFLPQAVARGLKIRNLPDRFAGFLKLQVIWAAVVLVFFTAARTKLPNYILPSFPALALLTGSWIDSLSRTAEPGFRGRSISWLVNLLPALLFPGLIVAIFIVRAPGFIHLSWLAVPMAAVGLVGAVMHRSRKSPEKVFRATAYAAVAALLCIYVLLIPRLEPLRMAPRLGKAIAQASVPGDVVASMDYDRAALYFYGKLHVVRVRGEDAVREFLSLPEGRFIVVTRKRFDQLPGNLRGGLKVLEEGLDALDKNEVVLVAQKIEPGSK